MTACQDLSSLLRVLHAAIAGWLHQAHMLNKLLASGRLHGKDDVY